jgi:hypothetical protein
VLPAIGAAQRICRDLLPRAAHVWVDTCERHSGRGEIGEEFARYANDRRFFVLDALLGRVDDVDRPFVREVVRNGGTSLLELEPITIDVLGLDYYAHCQWLFTDERGSAPDPQPPPFADLACEYHDRYGTPCMLTETNLRGHASDRASWLKYMLEQCEVAVARGTPILGFCWFPFVDSCDWDSLLQYSDGHVDPVGVYLIDEQFERRPSMMSRAYAAAASGTPAGALPAFTFREPVATWLAGYQEHTRHWSWNAPPTDEPAEDDAGVDLAEKAFEPLRGRKITDRSDPAGALSVAMNSAQANSTNR